MQEDKARFFGLVPTAVTESGMGSIHLGQLVGLRSIDRTTRMNEPVRNQEEGTHPGDSDVTAKHQWGEYRVYSTPYTVH